MANNKNSDGIQTNDSINESNDSNNNVFNLENLSKELVELKSELKEVNQLTKHLQKELTKEKAKKAKQTNQQLVKTDSQESETKVDEKLKDLPHLEPLFEEFDAKYFKGILKKNNVKVKYSKRLSVNSGVCRNEPVEIGISSKLHQTRSHKELIETLLHEMIHAFLFVTDKDDYFGGHGPKFVSIMDDINAKANTNITLAHDFNDEAEYQNLNKQKQNEMNKHKMKESKIKSLIM